MKPLIVCVAVSLACASGLAAEPPAQPGKPPASSPDKASPRPNKPLDLRIGDIRKYMTPEDFRALSTPPDESNTVVVKADAPLVPMKSKLDVPGGIIAPFWALAHPTQAWRIFLPDPRVRIEDIPPPQNKIPPPEFRWGP
jgi:hypothetical protein